MDKTMFLILAILNLFFIVLICILARYGSKISEDPSFNLFFSWYIGLVIINLLNILTTLLFHYFVTDKPGTKGFKGKPGEKGLAGVDAKCFCSKDDVISTVPPVAPLLGEDIHIHSDNDGQHPVAGAPPPPTNYIKIHNHDINDHN